MRPRLSSASLKDAVELLETRHLQHGTPRGQRLGRSEVLAHRWEQHVARGPHHAAAGAGVVPGVVALLHPARRGYAEAYRAPRRRRWAAGRRRR